MSKYTEKLRLFLTDMENQEDGEQLLDFDRDLNDNWIKVDNFLKLMSASTIFPVNTINSGNTLNGKSDILYAPGTGTAFEAWTQPVLSSFNQFGTITGSIPLNIFNAAGYSWSGGVLTSYWEFPATMNLINLEVSGENNPYKHRGTGVIKLYTVDASNNETLVISQAYGQYTSNISLSAAGNCTKIKIEIVPDGLYGADAVWIKKVSLSGLKQVTVSTATKLFFKVGGSYSDLKATFVDGESIDFQYLPSLDISGYTAGKYNIFSDKTGAIIALNNTISVSPTAPISPVQNDVWFDTSISPGNLKKYSGSAWQNFELIHLGSIVITGGFITSVETEPFNNKIVTVPNNIRPAYVVEAENNGVSKYRIWSDGFIEMWSKAYTLGASESRNVSLLKQFKNTNYYVGATRQANNATGSYSVSAVPSAVNSFTLWGNGHIACDVSWYACGY